MCLCIYVFKYLCVYVFMCLCMYVFMYLCVYVFMCLCIYVFMCLCIYVFMYIHTRWGGLTITYHHGRQLDCIAQLFETYVNFYMFCTEYNDQCNLHKLCSLKKKTGNVGIT